MESIIEAISALEVRVSVLEDLQLEDRISKLETKLAALEGPSAILAERERCARHVGSLLDALVTEHHVAYPVAEIVKALRMIEITIRNGSEDMLQWEPNR